MTTAQLNTFISDKMPDFTSAWFDSIKERVGYAESVTAFDQEIKDLMEAAVTNMLTGGVPEAMFTTEGIDKRILNTISLYANAYIGQDRTDTQMYLDLFRREVFRLSLEDNGAWEGEDDND